MEKRFSIFHPLFYSCFSDYHNSSRFRISSFNIYTIKGIKQIFYYSSHGRYWFKYKPGQTDKNRRETDYYGIFLLAWNYCSKPCITALPWALDLNSTIPVFFINKLKNVSWLAIQHMAQLA